MRTIKLHEKLSEELGRNVTGKEKDDTSELLKLLDLDSVESLDGFPESKRWERHYVEYVRNVLAPRRAQAKPEVKPYSRGPDLAKVQERVLSGE